MTAIKTVIYPVRDLDRAKAVFGQLVGAAPIVDESYYVQFHGVQSPGDELEIGLDPNGHSKGMTGPVSYWQVVDIETSVAALTAAGATIKDDVRSVGPGRRIATLTDADSNVIGLIEAG
jgi:predicted enzyme related to lactoylglutathione lyase